MITFYPEARHAYRTIGREDSDVVIVTMKDGTEACAVFARFYNIFDFSLIGSAWYTAGGSVVRGEVISWRKK